jgi:hypothetical protein
MIDAELIELGRALMLAADRLESEDFQARQIRLREIDTERLALAESLEADEAGVLSAQAAIQAHYLKTEAEAVLNDGSPFPEMTTDPLVFDDVPEIVAIETIDDEYATPKPNGADGDQTYA